MQTPRRLSQQAIDEFKAIYQDEFRQTLSDDDVQDIALRLLRFFGILRQVPPNEAADETPHRSGPPPP
jgi:hypothetical protein